MQRRRGILARVVSRWAIVVNLYNRAIIGRDDCPDDLD